MIARDPMARRRRSISRLALAALLTATPWLAPSVASAQGAYFSARAFYDEPDILIPPRAVVGRLQDRGFTEIARPRFDGTAYIVDATSPAGGRTRLFVDARDGAILGRRRLDIAYYPSTRPARSAPGYGWTEEEAADRTARGLVPPADIPTVPPVPARREAALGAPGALRSGIDGGPSGINPDARARPAPQARKAAKLAPPVKPAAPNAAPAAPAPTIGKTDGPKPEAAPDTATRDEPGADPSRLDGSKPVTPAANQPAAAGNPALPASDGTPPDAAKSDGTKHDHAWQDPPSDEPRRKVRVIDGATVVPGTGGTPAAGTN